MEISYSQLRQAFEQSNSVIVVSPDPDGLTAQELAQRLGLGRDATHQYIKQQIAAGKLKHIMLWRETIGGYRARTHGYQLI